MRDIQTSKVIFSVSKGSDFERNARNTRRVFEVIRAQGYQFRMLRGAYKGLPEESFLLYTHDAEQHELHLAFAIQTASNFEQESVLEVANDNAAKLHELDRGYQVSSVGTWREVTKDEAVRHDGYTCDVLTGRYFIVD